MAIVGTRKDNGVILVDSFKDIKNNIENYFFKVRFIVFFMVISAIFAPIIWFFLLVLLISIFNKQIWKKYFNNKTIFQYYIDEFSCPFAENGTDVFSIFGYEIDYETEWKEHYHRLKG